MGLRAWAQRWGDWVVALALAATAEFELWAHAPAGLVVTGGRAPLAVLFGVVTVPLGWRRRAPVAVLFAVTGALVVVAFLISHSDGVPLGVFLALIVAFYSVGAHCEERRALRVGAGVLAAIAAVDLTRGGVFQEQGARPAAWLVFAVAWLVGRDFRRRRGEVTLFATERRGWSASARSGRGRPSLRSAGGSPVSSMTWSRTASA